MGGGVQLDTVIYGDGSAGENNCMDTVIYGDASAGRTTEHSNIRRREWGGEQLPASHARTNLFILMC